MKGNFHAWHVMIQHGAGGGGIHVCSLAILLGPFKYFSIIHIHLYFFSNR